MLRTLASAAARACQRGDRMIVYGLDFATGALAPLEQLPNVASIIRGDDAERVSRLVTHLRDEVDDRVSRFMAVNASTLGQYRAAACRPEEPRILVLVDGIGTFWHDYQDVRRMRCFEDFTSVVLEGRSVGVHVVMTADRPAAIPSNISSSVQRRVLLRQANETDEMLLAMPAGVLSVQSPAGRGFVEGHEVQIAVLGGSADTTVQAHELARQGAALRSGGVVDEVGVGRLPERVGLADLPIHVAGRPAIGIADADLRPVGIEPSGTFLIAGPPRSGVTTATASLIAALIRGEPKLVLLHLGVPGAQLQSLAPFESSAVNSEEVGCLLAKIRGLSGLRPVLVIEELLKVLGRVDENGFDDLVGAVLAAGGMVVANGEISMLSRSYSPQVKSMQAHRSGLLLQPDPVDVDLLKTSFPRSNVVEFVPGRAILAQGGRSSVIQVAVFE
jgi:S-DNA-T family DNA segregation ATPase FtsK/SpoIIIE